MCLGLPTDSRATKVAELKLAVNVACHSAIRSVDHLGEVLKEVFPCDATAQLRLHRTKCGALIKNVVAPDLLRQLIGDMGVNQHYSLLIDESTDVGCKKMCVYGCIKVPLGMDLGLSPGDFVFDGNPSPLPIKGAEPLPNFRPTSIAAKRLHGSRCHLLPR